MGYLNPKVKGLMFPWTPREPEIGAEQLAEIDNLAELVEVMRLKSLGVLLPPEQVGSDNPKMLSTKFVITWRDKTIDGKRCWLRRARKVAREFNWLSEREDLFSPASSSVTSKLLPALYLHLKDQNPNIRYTMASADITDAFLTVPQKQPTLVKYGSQLFALGRVLPGQRDGSQLWFDSVTSFLKQELQAESCQGYPSLLRSAECFILLHVDDMLIVLESAYFEHKLVPVLETRYKVSVQSIQNPGDSVEFLKRAHVLIEEDTILVHQNPKHLLKLCEVVGVPENAKPKKVPCHESVNEVDTTEELSQAYCSRYRSAIGILMYLSSDLVECAYCIRALAQQMAKPTQRSWTMLKHLTMYLLGARSYALQLRIKSNGLWHTPDDEGDFTLEMFSDADWSACKKSRRSVSAGLVFFRGCLLLPCFLSCFPATE